MDVFVPFHAKDLGVLPLCLRGIRDYLRPAPARIFIVGRERPTFLDPLFRDSGVEFLNESSVIPGLALADMPRISGAAGDKTGWYFQQLLKWGVSRFAEGDFYCVVDADCVFIAPVDLREGDKYILYRGDQYELSYFQTYEKLLGYLPEKQHSFIVDFMIMDRSAVAEIVATIEGRHHPKRWHRAILDIVDPDRNSFSEFETCGYYMSRFRPHQFVSRAGSGTCLPNSEIYKHGEIQASAASRGFTSISYHSYLKFPGSM
jgi:hypothetical protein